MRYLILALILLSCQKEEVLPSCVYLAEIEYEDVCYSAFLIDEIYMRECNDNNECDGVVLGRELFPDITDWIVVFGEIIIESSGKSFFSVETIHPEYSQE